MWSSCGVDKLSLLNAMLTLHVPKFDVFHIFHVFHPFHIFMCATCSTHTLHRWLCVSNIVCPGKLHMPTLLCLKWISESPLNFKKRRTSLMEPQVKMVWTKLSRQQSLVWTPGTNVCIRVWICAMLMKCVLLGWWWMVSPVSIVCPLTDFAGCLPRQGPDSATKNRLCKIINQNEQ